jgi:hypothetical protein
MAWTAAARAKALEARRRKADVYRRFGIRADAVYPDNPGGRWLKWERKLVKRGIHPHGANTFTVSKARLPAKLVVKLPGESGEHNRIKKGNRRVTELAAAIKSKGRILEPIHIGVDYKGKATIFEGNHRARAAMRLHMKSVPVYVTYFAGGETRRGPVSVKTLQYYSKQRRK